MHNMTSLTALITFHLFSNLCNNSNIFADRADCVGVIFVIGFSSEGSAPAASISVAQHSKQLSFAHS